MSRLTKIVILMTSALQYVKLEDETQTSLESGETLPQPSALASPERSSLDEEQYNVSIEVHLPGCILNDSLLDGRFMVET